MAPPYRVATMKLIPCQFSIIIWTLSVAITPSPSLSLPCALSVLMLVVDDLRYEMDDGNVGNSLQIPSIVYLAKKGVFFEKAYAQYSVCSPSRSSVLTGLRPDTTRVFDLVTHFRANVPFAVTLPQHFRSLDSMHYKYMKPKHIITSNQ